MGGKQHWADTRSTERISCFGKLTSAVKLKLLYAYCSSYYGCELWDMSNGCVNYVCVTWRKGLRRVCALPYNAHNELLPVLCNTLPVFDVICKRMLSFLHTCVNSAIVRYVWVCTAARLHVLPVGSQCTLV